MMKFFSMKLLLAFLFSLGLGLAQFSNGSGTPGGSNTQLQYNNAGVFGGTSGATTNGTVVTLVAPILGTPASGTATNLTGLPLTTGVTGVLAGANGGTGVANTGFTVTLAGNLATTGTFNTTFAAVDSLTKTLPVGTLTLAGRVENTFTGQQIISLNGAASAPPVTLTGTIFTGGSATTTKPQFLVEPAGTTSTGWSTAGTLGGFNGPSGFTGNLLDAQVNGTSFFKVNSAGTITAPSLIASGTSFMARIDATAATASLSLNAATVSQANLFKVTMTGTMTQTSGSNGALTITPTYNQASGTAANTDLLINRTQTAVGSGAQLLIDAQVGGASQWKVTNAGLVTTIGETITGASFILSGLGSATGTPDAMCLNTNTVVRNAALTCTVSSENVKNSFSPIPGTMQDFMGLRPLAFEYNDKPGRVRWGFGAQQVASVNPALADGWRADGQPWSLDQNAILALTVKAVQELTAKVAELQK